MARLAHALAKMRAGNVLTPKTAIRNLLKYQTQFRQVQSSPLAFAQSVTGRHDGIWLSREKQWHVAIGDFSFHIFKRDLEFDIKYKLFIVL